MSALIAHNVGTNTAQSRHHYHTMSAPIPHNVVTDSTQRRPEAASAFLEQAEIAVALITVAKSALAESAF